MRIAFWLAMMAVCCVPLKAQHPFYVQVYEDGVRAMETGEWSLAARYLEIAAFGLLDDPAWLRKVYPRLTLSFHRTDQPEKVRDFLLKTEKVLPNLKDKPKSLSDDDWNQLLVLAGRREASVPALPDKYDELVRLVLASPDRADAWVSLVEKAMASKGIPRVRRHLDQGLEALPESRELLELGLLFAVTRDAERGAKGLATRLVRLNSSDPLANEYLAHKAFEKGDRKSAKNHLRHVVEPRLPGTESMSRSLTAVAAEEESTVDQRHQPAPEEAQPGVGVPAVDSSATRETAGKDEQAGRNAKAATLIEPPSVQDAVKETRNDTLEKRYRELATHLEAERWRKARRVLNALAKTDANSNRYAESWASYTYLRGNFGELVDELRPRSELTPTLNYYLGMAHWRTGQVHQAAHAFSSLNRDDFPELRSFDDEVGDRLYQGRAEISASSARTPCMPVVLDALDAGRIADAERMLSLCSEQLEGLEQDYLAARLQLAKGEYAGAKQGFMNLAKAKFLDYDLFFWAGKAALGAQDRVLARYFLDKAAQTSTAHEQEIRRLRSGLK